MSLLDKAIASVNCYKSHVANACSRTIWVQVTPSASPIKLKINAGPVSVDADTSYEVPQGFTAISPGSFLYFQGSFLHLTVILADKDGDRNGVLICENYPLPPNVSVIVRPTGSKPEATIINTKMGTIWTGENGVVYKPK